MNQPPMMLPLPPRSAIRGVRLTVLLAILSGTGGHLSDETIRSALLAPEGEGDADSSSLRSFLEACRAWQPAESLPSLEQMLEERFSR